MSSLVPPSPIVIPKPNVLLVDDYEANLIALEATLESLDVELVRATSGEAALEKLLREEFAVILLDVEMKGLDGLATAALIRQRERTRDVPIIFLTAHRDNERDVARAYQLGAVDYVTKPFPADALRAKVASLVDLWRRAERLRQREAHVHERERSDLLERERAARAEVEEQRALLAAVLEGVTDGIVMEDRKGEIVFANDVAALMRGFPSAEVMRDADIGTIRTSMATSDVDGHVVPTKDLPSGRAARGETVRGELLRFREGHGARERWVRVTSTPIFDEARDIRFVVTVTTDVTAAHEREDALRASEKQFRAVFDHALDAMILIDSDRSIVDANPASEALLRMSKAELLRTDVLDHVAPASRTGALAAWGPLLSGGQHRGEWTLERADGSSLMIEYSATANVLPHYHLLVMRDVDERRRAERSLEFLSRASEVLGSSLDYVKTLTAVATLSVPRVADWVAIDMIDGNGQIKRLAVSHVDPAKVALAEDIARRWPIDPAGQHGVANVLRTGVTETVTDIDDEMLVAAIPDRELLEVIRALGLRSSMCVALRVRGSIVGAISFIVAESGRRFDLQDVTLAEDLTRRASIAIDNALLYHEAVDANRLKDEFVSTLSHELRTPLTAIVGWVALMRSRKNDAATVERGLAVIERNANAQARLVEDVLDVSRIVTGKLRLELESIDVAGVIRAAVDSVAPSAEGRGITLDTDVASSLPIVGDGGRLQQVVWNLLTNAIRFTPRGGRVVVSAHRNESAVELRVQDDGQGIEASVLPFVFDRFRQGDSSTTRAHGGLGLGLAIVKRLVELHGGVIRAASEGPGHGATFTVSLPIGSLPREAVQRRERRATGEAEYQKSLDGARILVCDDEEDARLLLQTVFEARNAHVEIVASAASALSAIETQPFDVLVSDIGMPDEDGYSLIGKIRARPAEQGGDIVAIALTAYASDLDRRRALRAGFDAHATKPVEPEKINRMIAELLAR